MTRNCPKCKSTKTGIWQRLPMGTGTVYRCYDCNHYWHSEENQRGMEAYR